MSIERLQLRDGRVLEYGISGDPSWQLLMLHVGSPSAVTEFPHVSAAAAARRVRTAICSRPGYGASTRHRLRKVADVARDTEELADHLGAESFVVAGWSGGGPGALACASLLPNRVRACITLAGLAPPAEAGDSWIGWYPPDVRDEVRALLTKAPEDLVAEYEQAAALFADLTADALAQWPQNNPSDLAALRDVPAAGESLARSLRRGVSSGVWGWLDDEVAWARPWGFLVGDVRVPVIIRHGDEDRIVSVKQAHWLRAHIPGASLQELPGGGHTSVATPFEPVIGALLEAAS